MPVIENTLDFVELLRFGGKKPECWHYRDQAPAHRHEGVLDTRFQCVMVFIMELWRQLHNTIDFNPNRTVYYRHSEKGR